MGVMAAQPNALTDRGLGGRTIAHSSSPNGQVGRVSRIALPRHVPARDAKGTDRRPIFSKKRFRCHVVRPPLGPANDARH